MFHSSPRQGNQWNNFGKLFRFIYSVNAWLMTNDVSSEEKNKKKLNYIHDVMTNPNKKKKITDVKVFKVLFLVSWVITYSTLPGTFKGWRKKKQVNIIPSNRNKILIIPNKCDGTLILIKVFLCDHDLLTKGKDFNVSISQKLQNFVVKCCLCIYKSLLQIKKL